MRAPMSARPTTPPTTPPAMAPTLVELFVCELSSVPDEELGCKGEFLSKQQCQFT